MKQKKNKAYFTHYMFMGQYIPAIISAVVFSLADMADALVVGNNMGTLGLAAISFALPVFMVYNVIMHSLGTGGSISFSKKMTGGKEEEAVRSFQGVFYTLLISGIVIAVLGNILLNPLLVVLGASPSNPELFNATGLYLRFIFAAAPFFFMSYGLGYYMRNDDLEKEASFSFTVGNVLDLILNILLVIVFRMGVAGAAIATLTGVVVSSMLSLMLIHSRRSRLMIFPARPRFNEVAGNIKYGMSSCVSYIYSMIFLLIGNNAMMRLAGEDGVAVFDVVQNMSYLAGYVFGAVSQASQPVISTYEGECNYEECDNTLKLAMFTTLISCAALIVIMAVFPGVICRMFGLNSAESTALGTYAIRIFSVGVLFEGISLLYSNYYLSRSMSAPAFLISTLRGALILIPVSLICVFFGERAFWLTYPITEFITLMVFTVYVKVFFKQRKRVEAERIFSRTLHNDLGEISPAVEEIESFCEKWEAAPKQQYYVQMTVEEMCGAIIEKGFTGNNADRGNIQLTLVARDDNEFSLHVRDNASLFNPFAIEKKGGKGEKDDNPDFNALGMDVIKQKSKSFYYRRYQGFNTMVVRI